MSEEKTGGSCSYYKAEIVIPYNSKERKGYTAECGEIIEALKLDSNEAKIFSEIWRNANSRNGKRKVGNTPLRSAEAILFAANRIHEIEEWKDSMNDDISGGER